MAISILKIKQLTLCIFYVRLEPGKDDNNSIHDNLSTYKKTPTEFVNTVISIAKKSNSGFSRNSLDKFLSTYLKSFYKGKYKGNERIYNYQWAAAYFLDKYTLEELKDIADKILSESDPNNTNIQELNELFKYINDTNNNCPTWEKKYRNTLTYNGHTDLSYITNTKPIDSNSINLEQSQNEISIDSTTNNSDIQNQEKQSQYIIGGKNLLIYGAPGTGKSYYVDEILTKDFNYKRRVVFHPEYTYFDFVGSYKPVPVYEKTSKTYCNSTGATMDKIPGTPYIDYKFVAGPFIKSVVDAYNHPTEKCVLIIEELNRANAAAVFGDIFQLLDRDNNGESKYAIEPSEELQYYLIENGVREEDANQFRLPKNLFLYATMNSADQGVNYLDSAFKRRWNYKYLTINYDNIDNNAYIRYNSHIYTYKLFIEELNKYLQEKNAIEEDRLIGPWYIDSTGPNLNHMETYKPNNEAQEIEQQLPAINKLLLYLWDDLFRHKHGIGNVFTENSLNKLIEEFPKKNVLKLEISNLTSIDETENVDNEN